MCSLIVLRGVAADYPIVVAANRDEQKDRKAAPPGLFLGERHRMLSPRDRVAGGTWLCVDERGRFAGLTNVFGEPPVVDAPSRGHLPHLALDRDTLEDGVQAVLDRIAEHAHSAFQVVVADREQMVVLRHVRGDVQRTDITGKVLAITNEHAVGQWSPRFLEPALVDGLTLERRLTALQRVLADRGGDGLHSVCKHGERYGTVSSSLIAVPRGDITGLVWRFAPGAPDVTAYRSYGNLAGQLRG